MTRRRRKPEPVKPDALTVTSEVEQDTPMALAMAFESPESSNIVRAHYDGATLQLWIEFRRRKDEKISRTYSYHVPPQLWIEFYQAKSKGTFFAERIRPIYVGRLSA